MWQAPPTTRVVRLLGPLTVRDRCNWKALEWSTSWQDLHCGRYGGLDLEASEGGGIRCILDWVNTYEADFAHDRWESCHGGRRVINRFGGEALCSGWGEGFYCCMSARDISLLILQIGATWAEGEGGMSLQYVAVVFKHTDAAPLDNWSLQHSWS